MVDSYDNDDEPAPPPAAAPTAPEPEILQPAVNSEPIETAPAISNQQQDPSYENNEMSMNDYNGAMNVGNMGQDFHGQGYGGQGNGGQGYGGGDSNMGYGAQEDHDEPIGMKEDG